MAKDDFVHLDRTDGVGFDVRRDLVDHVETLQNFAVRGGVERGQPDYVPDSIVGMITPDPREVVDELCRAGMWERSGDGYRVLDTATVKRWVDARAQRSVPRRRRPM